MKVTWFMGFSFVHTVANISSRLTDCTRKFLYSGWASLSKLFSDSINQEILEVLLVH